MKASNARSGVCSSVRSSCSASSAIPSVRRRGRGLPHQRRRAGLAALVLSLEQHSRRHAARSRRARTALDAGRARQRSAPDGGRPARRRVRHQLRRSVAVPAESRCVGAGAERLPGLRRRAAAVVPARDRALLRQHRPRGSQRVRSAARRLHVPQRAAGETLRRAEREGQPLPARRAARRAACAAGCSGRAHPDRDVVSRSHVAGGAREVDSREPARHAAAAAAAERAAAAADQQRQAPCCRCGSGWSSIAPTRCAPAATR